MSVSVAGAAWTIVRATRRANAPKRHVERLYGHHLRVAVRKPAAELVQAHGLLDDAGVRVVRVHLAQPGAAQPERVHVVDGVVADVGVEVQPARSADRVPRQEPPGRRVVITMPHQHQANFVSGVTVSQTARSGVTQRSVM